MFMKAKTDGSIEPDTTDNQTKQTLNKKSAKEKMLETLQKAQLASSKAITKAFESLGETFILRSNSARANVSNVR